MKVASFYYYFDSNLFKSEIQGEDVELIDIRGISAEQAKVVCGGKVDIIIGWSPSDDLLRNLQPKCVFSPGAGLDWLNRKTQQEIGFKIVNIHVNKVAVAEFAFALLLELTKKISQRMQNVVREKGKLPHPKVRFIPSFELRSKKLGIIGFGAIGREIAKIGLGFGMKIRTIKKARDSKTDLLVERGDIEYVYSFSKENLSELLRWSDVVIVAAPLTSETRNLLSFKEFEQMKDTAYLINIARSELIDEVALLLALQKKQIKGVGTDTLNSFYQKENDKIDDEFHKLPNIIITPHVSWLTTETILKTNKKFAELVRKYIKDPEQIEYANIEKGY